MSNIFKKMQAASAKKIMSATKLIAEEGTEHVICGFKYAPNSKGQMQAVFEIADGGGFYATAWQKENLLPILEAEYKTPEAIDAHLKKHPQLWRMEKTVTQKGNPWISTEILEELEGEIEYDEPRRDNGAEGKYAAEPGESEKGDSGAQ